MNRLSKVFRPFNTEPNSVFNLNVLKSSEPTSKSVKLLTNYGFIRSTANGLYYLLPVGLRVIEKLTKLVDTHMSSIDAQKMSSPLLLKDSLWQRSKTFVDTKEDLYTVTDRSSKKFILSPTHEEAFTDLLANEQLSYRNFPLLLYQITPKFRDEFRPKLGLLRSKEFIMKDLYSFDIDQESAEATYSRVTIAYKKIFDALGVPYTIHKVGPNPDQGLKGSHEYYYGCAHGDDKLYTCEVCKQSFSLGELEDRRLCPGCSINIRDNGYHNGIEVAHTFNFGTLYSDRLKCNYIKDGKKKPLHMCSYGIGLSRLVSACVEMLSTENEIRFPPPIAPYTVCVIPPKGGSREEIRVELIMPELYHLLENIPSISKDVLLDDRLDKTIGKRLLEAKAFGIPFIVVAGKDAAKNTPLFELHDLYNDKRYLMPRSTLLQYLVDNTKYLSEKKHKFEYIS